MPNLFYDPNVETIYANAFFYAKCAYGLDIDMEKTAGEIFIKFTGKDAYPLMKARYGGTQNCCLTAAKSQKRLISLRSNYFRSLFIKNLVLLFAFLAMIIFAFYSLTVGSYESGFEMMKLLFVAHDETAWYLVEELRAPRVISSVLVGSALAVSGAVMQRVCSVSRMGRRFDISSIGS